MDLFQYKAEVIRVVDGDTIDASVDLGLILGKKLELDFKDLTHQNLEPEIWKKRKGDWLQKTELLKY